MDNLTIHEKECAELFNTTLEWTRVGPPVISYTTQWSRGCTPSGQAGKLNRFLAHQILPTTQLSQITKYRSLLRQQITEFTLREFRIEIEGLMALGFALTLLEADYHERPWIVCALPNAEIAEQVHGTGPYFLAQRLRANLLIANYPGVGTHDTPKCHPLISCIRALLLWTESPRASGGLGARQILLWGTSLGGGIIGELSRTHTFSNEIHYLVVRLKTFSTLATIANNLVFKGAGSVLRLLRWQMDGTAGSQRLEELGILEVIVQEGENWGALASHTDVRSERIVSVYSSLAHSLLLEKAARHWKHKIFIGDPGGHNSLCYETALVILQIVGREFDIEN